MGSEMCIRDSLSGAHYFDTTCAHATRRPLAPAAPRLFPRLRPPRLDIDHGVLRTATSTTATPPYALGYIDIGTKGYHPLEQLVGFLYSQRVRDATARTAGGCQSVGCYSLQSDRPRRSCCLQRYRYDCGRMLEIYLGYLYLVV